ncbi:hypothetical protein CZ814_00216 [Photobacterium toruni]|uniref:Uncharacterized protein n=1 Tax=Photobacterium toruni TaxID=1935446 RepID=A0A1T4KLD2_9GAMM|nr:hypothetical protein CZ814_00216 [Photobacterium toruni]
MYIFILYTNNMIIYLLCRISDNSITNIKIKRPYNNAIDNKKRALKRVFMNVFKLDTA